MQKAPYSDTSSAARPSCGLRFRLLAAALLVCGQLASADENLPPATTQGTSADPVDIQLALGFSDTVRLGHFAPVTVTLVNRGPALDGRLEVLVPDGDPVLAGRFTSTHEQRVQLPGDSRKRFRFTVYFESFARPLRVRVVAGERVIAERSVDLRPRVTTARLLLVLSRDADLDTLNDPREGRLRVLYPHPDLLPNRWQGYDGVAAMVVHGISLERLGDEQFAALRTWVTRGGILAVSGGPDYSLLATPRLAELLPGIPIGQRRVERAAQADPVLDTPSFGAAVFDVNRVNAFSGRVLLGNAALPLAIERPSGRGRVVYLTFDVAREPFRRWTGMRELWLDLLRLPPPDTLASQLAERPERSPLLEFVAAAARPFPGRVPLFLFLALYLGVLALGRLQPAAGRRAGWMLPLTTWLTPLVFALCAHLLFGRVLFPKRASAFVAGVIQPHGHGANADLALQLGWYANYRGDLRLEYEGVEAMFRPASADDAPGAGSPDWVFADGPHGALQPASRRGYQLQVVEGADVVAFDLKAQVTLTADGPSLVVRNNSGRPIVDAWLVLRGAAYSLGTIAPETVWTRTLDPVRGAVGYDDGPWFEVLRRDGDGNLATGIADSRRLAHAILEARHEANPPGDRALLMGQVNSPFRLAGASASWPRRELTLLLAALPVAGVERGRRGR